MFAVHPKLPGLFLLLSGLIMQPAYAGPPPLTHGLTPMQGKVAAPPLRLPNLDDEIIDLKQLAGKVVVVNFWATWCPPCRREMPSLERLYQIAGDKGVMVLAVNIGEDIDTVFPFLGRIEPSPSFPLLFDKAARSMSQWKVKGLPTTYVVGPDGNLVYRAVGGREFDHPDVVKQLLDLSASPTD